MIYIYNWSDLKKKGTGMDIELQIIMVCRGKMIIRSVTPS
jgi:hypothetical protein